MIKKILEAIFGKVRMIGNSEYDSSRKHDGDDEAIAAMADNYYDMMQMGIDNPPAPLSDDTINNPYARQARTLQLIAYSKAVGRRSNQTKGNKS